MSIHQQPSSDPDNAQHTAGPWRTERSRSATGGSSSIPNGHDKASPRPLRPPSRASTRPKLNVDFTDSIPLRKYRSQESSTGTPAIHRPKVHDQQSDYSRKEVDIDLLDISQSRWIEDPNNHANEQVYLTIEAAPLDEMSTIETKFCWIHHRRAAHHQFEDFVRILNDSPGLYEYEHNVALKCLEEVKEKAHVFAKGKYFDPMVHQVRQTVEVAGSNTEVNATFISIPILSAMQSQEPIVEHHHDFGYLKPLQAIFKKAHKLAHEEEVASNQDNHEKSQALRALRGHPIRALMQYSNMLAVNNERDLEQSVLKLEDNPSENPAFVHVPEFWALIINMYTIITCAPFSVEQLQGNNIFFRSPPKKDRRVMVKYISLQDGGALHEFRCRTWVGLLNTIGLIESRIDADEELSILLNKRDSEYKLIDAKFTLIDRDRWFTITNPANPATKVVEIRLVKVSEGDPLSVAYSKRKFLADRALTWHLMHLKSNVKNKQDDLTLARQNRASNKDVAACHRSIRQLQSQIKETRRRRTLGRYLLYAARYRLIDPDGILFAEDQIYLDAVRERDAFRRTGTNSSKGSRASREWPVKAADPTPAQLLHYRQPNESSSTLSLQTPDETKNRILPLLKDNRKATWAISTGLQRVNSDQAYLQHNDILIKRHEAKLCQPEASDTKIKVHPTKRAVTFGSHTSMTETPHDARGRFWLPRSQTLDLEAQKSKGEAKKPILVVSPAAKNPKAPTFKIGVNPAHIGRSSTRKSRSNLPLIFQTKHDTRRVLSPSRAAVAPPRIPVFAHQDTHLDSVGDLAFEAHIPLRKATENGSLSIQLFKSNSLGATSSTSKLNKERFSAVTTVKLRRAENKFKDLQPFFDWKPSNTSDVVGLETTEQGSPTRPPIRHSVSAPVTLIVGDFAQDTLDIMHMGMNNGPLISDDFPIQPVHYAEISLGDIDAVLKVLDLQSGPTKKRLHREEQKFLDRKLKIVLFVDAILRCFVREKHHSEPLIRKVFGLLEEICLLDIQKVKQIAPHFDHCEGMLLTWVERELGKIETVAREMLMSARSDTGQAVEQLDLPLPGAFQTLFRDFVLFLLSITLVAKDPKTYAAAADIVREKIEDDITECETALMRSALELGDVENGEFLDESINTADTLYALLLQNALALCCSNTDGDGKNSYECDLEYIYRRWTGVCHERATREASAKMYEEVRLLHEELSVITQILEDQKSVIEKTAKLRESPRQKIDIRINKRTDAFLDDMIQHFKTLKKYAKEAEDLTTNYIRVSNEDNSKAIYVFTTVTVIFLPLSFISSVLGMNTKDIRTTRRTSSMFWEIAVPVTVAVLIMCLVLVHFKFKFKLRRRVGGVVLKFFPKSWAERHALAKQMRRMPRQGR